MKVPSLFKCCTAEHNEGNTKITVKSRCFDRPIIFNVTNDIDPEQLINDIVRRMTKPKEAVAPVAEASTPTEQAI